MQRQPVRLGVLREDVFVCVSVENPSLVGKSKQLRRPSRLECGRSYASRQAVSPEIKLRGGTATGCLNFDTVFGAISRQQAAHENARYHRQLSLQANHKHPN
jgi:hypothetical protein